MNTEYPLLDKKLFTEKAIAGATLLGGPAAGIWLMSKNYRTVGLKEKANKWLYWGFAGTTCLFYVLF